MKEWFIKYFGIWTSAWWICVWNTIKRWFTERYEITVSFNKEWGDADDRTYVTKKLLVQKEKHLKFRTVDGEVVEYRSAAGLNYIIKEL